jgi:two-component system, OmpR family, phosphate regulon sensor histidine kinase PhoR
VKIRNGFGQQIFSAAIGVAVVTLIVVGLGLRVALPDGLAGEHFPALALLILVALATSIVAAALFAFGISRRLTQRTNAIVATALRYYTRDLTPSAVHYGNDELGVAARAMDDAIQAIAQHLDALERDRSRMEAILAGMIEGVIVVDPSGRVQLANSAARQMLKLEDLALERHYVEAIRHPAITDLLGSAIAGRTPESVQLTPPRDTGRTLMARAAPALHDGANGAVLVLHDITDLKRTDQIRRDFVANVSHELRTPLTAIRGYVEALSEPDTSPEDSRRFLDIIMRHALRMERLVQDLLRLARLDAGQEALDIVTCDTRALAQSVAADLATVVNARGQRIDVSVSPGAEAVRADPVRLHDVLRNLLVNASTYAPSNSTIAVHAAVSGAEIAIDVDDDGPGLPEVDLERVFERFYRVEKSRARDPGGTGIGLAIVKHLVELMEGRVRATNRPEGGARFSVTLPRG